MWFSSMFALIVTNDSHWKENALRNITLCVMQALFSTSPKNSWMKKLKTQGKNSKLKAILVKIIAENQGIKSENEEQID